MEAEMNAPVTIPSDVDLALLLADQRAAFLSAGAPSFEQRKADLSKLKKAVLALRQEFAVAIDADFGHRPAYETAIMEVMPIIQGIDYLRARLRRWMRQQRRHVPLHALPGKARVLYQPLGVVGIVSPWNFPLGLSLMPVATAIAAGNRVMLKPSELTPATTALMASMLGDIFP